MTITSRANPIAKYVRSLHRRTFRHQERAFIVEGERAVGDALTTGAEPRLLLCETGWRPRLAGLDEQIGRVPSELVRSIDAQLFADLADTVTPAGIMAVFDFPSPVERQGVPLIVLADGLRDPGNLGTLLRSAAAAGVSRVHLAAETVDPYNPKVVRAAMGAHFHIPIEIEQGGSHPAMSTRVQTRVLAESGNHPAPEEIDWTGPSLLIIGSEASGPGAASKAVATHHVSIPLEAGIESLNAAVAASVILFEASRQRRKLRNTAHHGGFHQSSY